MSIAYVGYEGRDCDATIDDCKQNKCKNGATCIDKHLTYECKCDIGYSGL